MKSTELRIGNICDVFGVPTPVTSEMINSIAHIERRGKVCIDVTPIPLTEEWLIKFGFTPIDLNEGLALNHVIIYRADYKDGSEYHGWHYIYNQDYMQRTTILKYVHQLQNLYFVLIGEELIINSSKK